MPNPSDAASVARATLGTFGSNVSMRTLKQHMATHYPEAIRMFGAVEQYRVNAHERMHKDYAKDPVRKSNKQIPSIMTQVRSLGVLATAIAPPRCALGCPCAPSPSP